ncbi:MAG: hypothetical protein LW636_03565 [Planctomycetaceae bacterium]|jgi:hypothetical protein|nr:hypothetical protein [Planctomycetaceae bacterium]
MHPVLVKFLAVLILLSQGWLGAVRGHSVCIELTECTSPMHAEHAHGHGRSHAFDDCAGHAHDESQHDGMCDHVLGRHDHAHTGCHIHVCLPELEQRGQAALDVRAFARLLPFGTVAPIDVRAAEASVRAAMPARYDRSDGPPDPERVALSSTVILV